MTNEFQRRFLTRLIVGPLVLTALSVNTPTLTAQDYLPGEIEVPEKITPEIAKMQAELTQAVPDEAEMPGFDKSKVWLERSLARCIFTTKGAEKKNGRFVGKAKIINVVAAILPTPAAAHNTLMSDIAASQPVMQVGSHTNRKIGEEAFQPKPPVSDDRYLGWVIITRDGCSYVSVQISNIAPRMSDTLVTEDDYKQVEDIAIKTLAKLTKLGHTSQPAGDPATASPAKLATTSPAKAAPVAGSKKPAPKAAPKNKK